MSSVRTLNAGEGIEDILAVIEEDGCAVIEGLLSAEAAERLQAEMDAHFSLASNCRGDFYGYETKRLSGLIAKSEITRAIAIDPVILSVMDEYLLRGCSDYQLNLTQAIRIGPGEIKQFLHRDDLMFPYAKNGLEAMINCMWAVDDFTKENGATQLVPGSHKWAPERVPLESEVTQGLMKSGSVLIYLGSLIHGGGANKTMRPRTGLVVSYCCGWLRQAENQYLAVPMAMASHLPERLQRLLGYFVHKPNLGSVEGQDPITLLQVRNDAGEKIFTEFLPDEVKPLLQEYRAKEKEAA